jgi:hypothetical protein
MCSVKQEGEPSPAPAQQCQTAHNSAHKESSCNNGVDCFSSSPYCSDSAPSDLHIFLPLEGYTLMTTS